MAMTTEFIVASDEELRRAFPTFVMLEARTSEVSVDTPQINPFTGEPMPTGRKGVQKRREYVPIGQPYVETHPPPPLPWWKHMLGCTPMPVSIRGQLPRLEWTRMDHMVVATLHHALDDTDVWEAMDDIVGAMTPTGEVQESGVERLSSRFTRALAAVDDDDLQELASRWIAAPEVPCDNNEDAVDAIVELRGLARIAVEQGNSMFLYWSL